MSRPALATLGLPISGAASSALPRAASSWRTCADASAEMVEQSTRIDGIVDADASPPGPSTASMRSWDVPTVAKTMSLLASSAAESTTFAPRAARGWALDCVRL